MTINFNNQTGEEGFLFDGSKKNPFIVPEGYFESFPAKVLHKMEAAEELKQYAALSAIEKKLHFIAPQDYFIKNENLLEYRYELSAYGELSKLSRPVLKPLPEEYLNTLSAKILKRIEVADELKAYTTLSEFKKEKVFAVEPGYFETIADNVKERNHSGMQQFSIIERLLNFILKPKMVFAYSFILIAGVGAFFYLHQPEQLPVVSGDCKTLACLERKELLNEHTMQNLDDDNLYDLVDVDELDRQLSEPAADSLSTNTDSLPAK